MTPERWQQIDKVLEQAVHREPGQRRAFLDEACAGDEELRREVESLLVAYQTRTGKFLDQPALQLLANELAGESPSLVGQRLGPYQILSLLGTGGMGEVYKARDTRLNRTVAIKAVPRRLSDRADLHQRFAQEARAASALNHPSIITIHDILNDNGRDFIVMECVEGKTLGQLIRRRGMKLNDALGYAIQIADALAKAHAAGIIHRDLKPGNVMVGEGGLVKILDFGLAKITERPRVDEAEMTDSLKAQTEEGMLLGTPAYMSPEQVIGKVIDARSDIFSFGSIVRDGDGQRAFQGDSKLSTLGAVLNQEPKSARQISSTVPQDLQNIIDRCLRKDPDRRFQHMADVKVFLQELLEIVASGKPTETARSEIANPRVDLASPATSREELRNEKPAPRESRTRLWLWVGLMLLAAVGLSLWFVRTPKSGTSSLRVVPLTSYPGRERYPSFSPDGKQVVFSWDGEHQDNEDIYVKQVGTESRRQLTTHPAEDFSPTWSPDGNWIAFLRRGSGGKATMILISPLGGRERPLGEFQRPWVELWSMALSWSPDNHWVAVPDQPAAKEAQGIFLVSVETGERHRLTSTPAFYEGDYNPVFSPDGQTLAFARFVSGAVSDLYLLPLSKELSTIGEPTRLTFENRRSFSAAWTPEGSELLFVSGGRHHPGLWRVPVSARTQPQHLELGGSGLYLYSPTLSHQGDLVFTQRVSDVNIWRTPISGPDRKAGTPTSLISSSFLDHEPEFSPDGRKIGSLSYRSGNAEIWVCDSDGSNAYQLTSFEGPECDGPRWSPDSQQIAFSANQEGQSELYSIGAEGGKPRRLTIHPANDGAPSWSQDGKWILFTSNRTSEYQVWKMPTDGGEAVQVTKHGGAYAIESPDGRYIYFLKGRDSVSSLWRILPDGTESQVLDSVYAVNYAVVKDGIYFIPAPRDRQFAIHFLSFSNGKTNQLASISKEVQWGLSVSPDERWIVYSQMDHRYSDLMLVKNFR